MKLDKGRLELVVFIIVSDLVVIMYFIHKSYRGVNVVRIKKFIMGKYVGKITLFSYIG